MRQSVPLVGPASDSACPAKYKQMQKKHDDQELSDLILNLEDKLLAEGLDPKSRHWELPHRVMSQLGYDSYICSGPNSPELFRRIRKIHQTLYRTKDVSMGSLHGGAFMFRGIAAQIRIPLFFGSVKIHPFKHNDLSFRQIKWLRSDPEHSEAYVSNFSDLFDFSACLRSSGGYAKPPEPARPLFGLAAFQIQGAGATLCAGFDERGAIQSSLIGAELALKAALAGKGVSDADLKEYGHNLPRLVEAVGNLYGSFELASVKALIRLLPGLVDNRYSPEQPSRMETGAIVMTGQYIAGAVARAVTGGSFRAKLEK